MLKISLPVQLPRPAPAALLCLLLAAVPGGRADAPAAPPYHLIKKIPITGDTGWDYLSLDPDSRRLYISRSSHVDILNVDTEKLVGQVPDTPGVHGIALVPALGRGFTSNGQDNSVTVFDLAAPSKARRVKVGQGPDAIIYDPATRRVFTFNGGSSDATALDAAAGKVVGTIPLGGRPEFAVADGKGTVFVNLEDKSQVLALDAKALTVLHRWPLAPGEGPSGIAMDPVHRRVFATCHNQKMIVLDADSGKVVAAPAIGSGPDACLFDPENGLAFSSNGQDGTLTVIHEDSPSAFRVAETVPTQAGARTMALDAKSHRIYLVTAQTKPPAPGARPGPPWRRAYVPGSFVILVVGTPEAEKE